MFYTPRKGNVYEKKHLTKKSKDIIRMLVCITCLNQLSANGDKNPVKVTYFNLSLEKLHQLQLVKYREQVIHEQLSLTFFADLYFFVEINIAYFDKYLNHYKTNVALNK